MKALTERQQQIVAAIREYISKEGIPPTRVELAEIMGFSSPNAVHDHLVRIREKGYISMRRGTARGIKLIEPEAA